MGGCIWIRLACGNGLANQMGADCSRRNTCIRRHILYSEVIMKVVLIQNPKFIGAILRKIYGIKKEEPKH